MESMRLIGNHLFFVSCNSNGAGQAAETRTTGARGVDYRTATRFPRFLKLLLKLPFVDLFFVSLDDMLTDFLWFCILGL